MSLVLGWQYGRTWPSRTLRFGKVVALPVYFFAFVHYCLTLLFDMQSNPVNTNIPYSTLIIFKLYFIVPATVPTVHN